MPKKLSKVVIGKTNVKAEHADNILKKFKGLSFRRNMPNDSGMLFDFRRDSYPGITTMSMLFPLDIIWIDSKSRVVHIKKNAKPMRFWEIHVPKEKARFVLEVNSGFADKNKIKVGHKVKIN
jgi:hypothetical protein